ncbi:SMP-30/gluconolactonase/LRE family protein [Uliginosibacterium sp. H3]|uniref:SMP-30/gluconolactonase/LRE family protein n=1 Tax=Uliginosibacterium silvisoli TaxID=3114758 RepID=A0ABU6K334_9RHOO|nr:SMP-30/gluconolactonase/LRE family protein [Uliginosibacterium sp. H3]
MNPRSEITVGPEAVVSLPFSSSCGESPYWSPVDAAFFWVDIPAGRIHRWSPADNGSASWQLPEQIGCIVRQRSGGVLAACETGIYSAALQSAQATVVKHASIEHPAAGMRFNDGRCDRHGRLWVTTFMTSSDKRAVGGLFRYTTAGLSEALLDGFMTPNGMAFSPDNRTLYIADSHASVRKVWAVDFDIDDGVLGTKRVFVDLAGYAARPDGAAIDTDGCYWVAGMDDGCIMRFTPQGALDQVIRLPVRHPTMCSFGGPDMKSMFITSLKRSNIAAELDPLAGNVLCITPGAQGIIEEPFAG